LGFTIPCDHCQLQHRVGAGTLALNIADGNTATGTAALLLNTTGPANTANGAFALLHNDTGNSNTANSFSALQSNITGGFNTATGSLALTSNTTGSDNMVKPIEAASEALYRLKPVSYRYKKEIDSSQSPAFGLIAKDVAEVNPAFVACNSEGQAESVHYEMVNAMLLNEFLKEQKAFVQEQRKVQELEKRVENLAAGLQKVTAQIQLGSPAAQMAANQK
jgi:hypothetical protein